MAENFLLRVISTEGTTQTYFISGVSKESLSIKAKAGSKYSIVGDKIAANTTEQINPSSTTSKPKLKLKKVNNDLLLTSEDEVSQIKIENFYKEPNVSISGDELVVAGENTSLLSDANGSFVVEQVQTASFAVASAPLVATNTMLYGLGGVGVLAAAGGGGGGSTAVDKTAPEKPNLVQAAGVSNGATREEALAGAMSITAETGSTIKVTFTDANNRSVIKTIAATGAPQVVTLAAADLGTGANQLGEGLISVKAVATDAAGNSSSEATSTFTLDTSAPKLSTTVAPTISKTTLAGTPGDGAGETIALKVTFDSAVEGLTNGTNNTVFKVGTRFVNATWSGTAGSNTRTLTYTIQAGDNGQASIDEDALKAAVLAGLKDAAGNGFDSTALIANIDVGNNTLPTVTTSGQIPLTVVQSSGASNGATREEALAGAMSITAETGSTIKVTFTDANNRSVIKTIAATGAPQVVTLAAADLGTGANQLGEGLISVKAVATDAAGNTSSEATSTFTLDTRAPEGALIQLAAVSDSGPSKTDGQTNLSKPTLTGTGEKGAFVKIKDGSNSGAEVATTTVLGDGTWTATVTGNLSAGVHHLYASIEDAAGNVTTPTVNGKVLARSVGREDTSSLGPSGVTIDGVLKETLVGVGVTVLNADGTLKSHTVYSIWNIDNTVSETESTRLKDQLAGTFAAGEQVIITTGDEWATKMSADAKAALATIGGTRSIADNAEFRSSYLMITTKTATGWTVDYEQYNPRAANKSLEAYADRDIQTVNIDTVGTTVELMQVVGVSETNSKATKAEALAGVVKVKVNGGVDVNVTFTDINGNSIIKTIKGSLVEGNTSAQLVMLSDADIGPEQGKLNDGVITVTAVAAADAAGNTGVVSSSSFTLDTKLDAALIQLAAASDSGPSNTDGQTNVSNPILRGTGEVGAIVKIRDGSINGTEVAAATVGADGTWSATVTATLSAGVHHLYAIIEDAAGNVTTPTSGGKLVARSIGREDAVSLAKAGVTINGDLKATDVAGVGVTVLNADGTLKSHGVYKTYDETASEAVRLSGLLKSKLAETFTTGEQVIITTNDDWANKMTADGKAALANIGATRSIVDNAELRSSYLMITTKTATGWTVDYEQYNPRAANKSLEAYADRDIQTVNIDTRIAAVNMSVSAENGRTTIKKPILEGAGEVGATVTIRDGSINGAEVATATVGGDGRWTATVTTDLSLGVHQLYASIQDRAGNINTPTGGVIAKSLNYQNIATTEKSSVTVGGQTYNPGRGLTVTVLKADGALKSMDTYDAYTDTLNAIDTTVSTNLINKLASANYAVGETVIITINDDWTRGFSDSSRSALVNIGGSLLLIDVTNPGFRSSFVMITKRTDTGWAVDYQDYQAHDRIGSNPPLIAYGDSNIQTVKILPVATSLVEDTLTQSGQPSEFGTLDAALVYNGNTYVMAKSKLNHNALDIKLGNDGGDTTVAATGSTKAAVKGMDTSYASVLNDGKTYVLLDTAELNEVLQQANVSLWDASTKLANEGFWTANQAASNAHAYIADTTHQVYAGADALEKWTVFKVL